MNEVKENKSFISNALDKNNQVGVNRCPHCGSCNTELNGNFRFLTTILTIGLVPLGGLSMLLYSHLLRFIYSIALTLDFILLIIIFMKKHYTVQCNKCNSKFIIHKNNLGLSFKFEFIKLIIVLITPAIVSSFLF